MAPSDKGGIGLAVAVVVLAFVLPEPSTARPPILSGDLPEKMYEGMIISYEVAPVLGIKTTWVTEIFPATAPRALKRRISTNWPMKGFVSRAVTAQHLPAPRHAGLS